MKKILLLVQYFIAFGVISGLFMIITGEPAKISANQTYSNLVGSWSGSKDCEVVIVRDQMTNFEAHCDNDGFNHRLDGFYTDIKTIKVIVTRTDKNKTCTTSTNGAIRVNDMNSLDYFEEGWKGCGANTNSGHQIWNRIPVR